MLHQVQTWRAMKKKNHVYNHACNCCLSADRKRYNIANQIHGFTIDYGKFILICNRIQCTPHTLYHSVIECHLCDWMSYHSAIECMNWMTASLNCKIECLNWRSEFNNKLWRDCIPITTNVNEAFSNSRKLVLKSFGIQDGRRDVILCLVYLKWVYWGY